MTTNIRIFLASSAELQEDRNEFEIFINRQSKDWVQKGVLLELVLWADFLDAVSPMRLQDEYKRAIRECDLFVMLFFTKVGRYTEEAFETAFGPFQATRKPFLFTSILSPIIPFPFPFPLGFPLAFAWPGMPLESFLDASVSHHLSMPVSHAPELVNPVTSDTRSLVSLKIFIFAKLSLVAPIA